MNFEEFVMGLKASKVSQVPLDTLKQHYDIMVALREDLLDYEETIKMARLENAFDNDGLFYLSIILNFILKMIDKGKLNVTV